MGELIFVGLGLYDELGLSLRGQEELRKCDDVFAEFYTSVMPGLNLQNLALTIGKHVQILSRADVEEHAEDKILSKARSGKAALLVAGDPMVATTHVALRLRAEKAGIGTRIIHGASVASAAAGVTGLQSYKFGRTVTIPVSHVHGLAESVYVGVRVNLEAGLHSLILLDVDVEGGQWVTINRALEQLLAFSATTMDKSIKPHTLVLGLARLGAPDTVVKAGSASDLMCFDFGKPPYCIIVPGKLHFVEAEALHVFCGAPRKLVGSTN